jgi:hypothetical protein
MTCVVGSAAVEAGLVFRGCVMHGVRGAASGSVVTPYARTPQGLVKTTPSVRLFAKRFFQQSRLAIELRGEASVYREYATRTLTVTPS